MRLEIRYVLCFSSSVTLLTVHTVLTEDSGSFFKKKLLKLKFNLCIEMFNGFVQSIQTGT